MPVVPSTLINQNTEAQPTELWDLAHLLWPQWNQIFTNYASWHTDVQIAKTGHEQRRGRIGRPKMSTRYRMAGWGQERFGRAQIELMRAAHARSLAPVWSDTATVPPARNTATTITCGVSYRRFWTGQRILIWDPSTLEWEINSIDSMTQVYNATDFETEESITLGATNGLAGLRVRVTPLFEARLLLNASLDVFTDEHLEYEMARDETPGTWMLEPHAVPGNTSWLTTAANVLNRPFTSWGGYPILDIHPHYGDPVTITVERAGNFTNSGTSEIPVVFEDRARIGYQFTVRCLNRINAWRFKKLFDYAAGRLYPFWVPSPGKELAPTSYTSSTMIFPAVGSTWDWNLRPFVGILARDGTVEIRRVTSSARFGNFDVINYRDYDGTTISTFTIPLVDARRVFAARLCRFRSDEMEERWFTPEAVDFALDVLEVPNEYSVTIGGDGGGYSPLGEAFDPTDNMSPLSSLTFWDPDLCVTSL